MSLTTKNIEAALPRSRLYSINDADGLSLAVHPSGGKHWRLRYRFGGRETTLSLGTYPAISLADARRLRDDARKLLAEGRDPLAAKAESKYRRPRRQPPLPHGTVFQLALADDGSLTIQTPDATVRLSDRQVAALRQFLSIPVPGSD